MGLLLSSCMVVLLTLFYRGLLELSKSFLDPFGNDGSRAQNIYVDVIIQEVNGALDRLIEGSSLLPKLRDDPSLPLELSSGRRVDSVPPVADEGDDGYVVRTPQLLPRGRAPHHHCHHHHCRKVYGEPKPYHATQGLVQGAQGEHSQRKAQRTS